MRCKMRIFSRQTKNPLVFRPFRTVEQNTEYRIQIAILYSVFCFTTWFNLTLNLITDITSKKKTTHIWTTTPIECSTIRTNRTGILSIPPCS